MVDEEKKETEKKESEVSVSNFGEGSKSETVKETERLRLETEELNKAIAEKENADARAKIGGVSAGAPQVEEKKEETPKEYKDKVMKGEIPLKE